MIDGQTDQKLQRILTESGIVKTFVFTRKLNVCSNLAESGIANEFMFTHNTMFAQTLQKVAL